TVTATISVANFPLAHGIFISIPVPQPSPAAGNLCNGSITALSMAISRFPLARIASSSTAGSPGMSGTCSQQLHGWRQRGDSGGGTYSLGPAATIGGNLSIQKIPVSNAFNSICGTTVYGNMQFANNGTAVQMGTTVPVFCAGNTIGRALEVV